MRHLLPFLLFAASAFAQTATITDTIATPFAGTFSGTVTVSLNSPALAQPLYSGSVTLSGWTQTVTVTAGAFALTLYTNDLITPGGTSYTATYAPTSGSGWKETWIVPTGATTIREIRSTTVPSPSVRFTPSQITQAGATLGQGLRWNGSIWAPAAVLTDPMTTTGDLITRSGINAVRLGIGSTNQVLTVSGGMPVWASGITGNASTATALAANGTNCTAGSFPLGVDASGNAESCTAAVTASTGLSDSADIVRGGSALTTVGSVPFVTAAGVLGQDTGQLSWSSVGDRLTIGNASAVDGAGILTQSAGTVRWTATPGGGGAFVINNSANTGIFFQNNSITHAIINSTGNFLLGTGTDGNFRLDVGSSGSSGTTRIYDQTPTTGSTSLIVRAGAGQGSNNLTTWQNSGGTEVARVNAGGGMAAQEFFNLTGTFYQNGVNVDVGSGGIYRFANSASQGAAKDLSLSRASVNTLQVGDGGANANGILLFKGGTVYDSAPTTGSTSLVVRAGAGQSSNNLQTWQNSAGTAVAALSPTSGAFLSVGGFNQYYTTMGGSRAVAIYADSGPTGYVLMSSDTRQQWTSATGLGGSTDLSLSRASANVLQVGDGSANSNGTIVARIHTWANGTEGTCDATLRGQVVMVQGGAGVADTFRICRKDAANAYAWTALY